MIQWWTRIYYKYNYVKGSAISIATFLKNRAESLSGPVDFFVSSLSSNETTEEDSIQLNQNELVALQLSEGGITYKLAD